MKKIFALLLCYVALGSLSAQSFNIKVNPFPNSSPLLADTLKILAVMVSFQEDKDASTFGNGKFGSMYSKNYGNSILDPLPHDRKYFENHLEFVKNYFRKVSNSKLNIEYFILPDTFSVSKTMRNYSPPPKSNDLSPLGEFAKEVWTLANQLYPNFRFSDYNMFLIFHAGVGRDVTLPGSLGNERDLPSVYLSEKALKSIFGGDFNGFPVQNGNFRIKNSAIIPSTESRELQTLTGTSLVELTINGLLVSTVASHLGLPDLFDTETGLSAIGRFGLMDGQSIFAYNGCFPPEPSAWEKIYLGWVSPNEILELSPSELIKDLTLPAKLASSNQPYIIKIPINSSEYFLIENKQRDVLKNGAVITYRIGNQEFSKSFVKDTTGFRSFDTDSLAGVIVNVDEFDWAIPGNGILIWHIDENIISQKIADNKINSDKKMRGVDVEEADGIQDIGEKFRTIFGDELVGEGNQFDLWYAGNTSQFYKNRFDKNSRPSTHSNTGANSLISIFDFSESKNLMTFKVAFRDSIIKPIYTKQFPTSETAKSISSLDDNSSKQIILIGKTLFIIDSTSIDSITNFSDYKPAVIKFGGSNYIIGATYDSRLQFPSRINYIQITGNNLNQGGFNTTFSISGSPVLFKNPNETIDIIVPTYEGKILFFDLSSYLSGNLQPRREIIINQEYQIEKLSIDTRISALGKKRNSNVEFLVYLDGVTHSLKNQVLFDFAATKFKNESLAIVLLAESGVRKIKIFNKNGIYSEFEISYTSGDKFILSDLKSDGTNYIVTSDRNKIEAFNLQGARADNFPFTIKDDEFNGWLLSADIEGDNKSEIIAFTKKGNIYAINGGTGKLVDGFPISIGKNNFASPSLFTFDDKICLSAIDKENKFYSWKISSIISKIDWSELNGNKQNLNFAYEYSSSISYNRFFPENRAYNYPNPVYESTTAIRFYVSEDATVNVKIFDLAGEKVDELVSTARGGFDNEIIWNVSSIQSGVYLARIEAKSNSGKTESTVIKIAVVK
ncbi:MAG: T9SS type A sorting domain-containing protein [Ignavibacterium sp.]|nr:T9SS type A sorting domain-containing protein [Ignavibacterium sp.]MDW8374943.1 T9SS type A sorting domain-containing protein [Ignavibacteriales bacterium]